MISQSRDRLRDGDRERAYRRAEAGATVVRRVHGESGLKVGYESPLSLGKERE